MKRAQTEIMGLVILVILILISAVFAIRFIMYGNENIGPEVSLSVQANNLQSALLKLDFDDKYFSDYMVDCCNNNCDFFKNTLPSLINDVLPHQDYELEVLKGLNSCYKTEKKCQKSISGIGKITKNGESYRLNILLCD